MRNIVRTILVAMTVLVTGGSALADTVYPSARDGAILHQVQDDRPWRNGGRGGQGPDGVPEGNLVPLEAIINGLVSNYPGRYLDSEGPTQRAGRLVYDILWLTPNGRKIVIVVDAQNGQVIRVRGMG